MHYLDKFDNYKRKHCEELSTKDKLRTGYTNKNQLQQGLNIFKKNTAVSVDDTKLMSILYPDVRDKVRIGQKISSGGDQLLAIYDDGIADNSLSEFSFNTVSEYEYPSPYEGLTDASEEREVDSPPASVFNPDETEQRVNELIEMFQQDQISERELMEQLSIARGYEPDVEEPSFQPRRGGRRVGAGRYSRKERMDAYYEKMKPKDIRAINQALEEAIDFAVDDDLQDAELDIDE